MTKIMSIVEMSIPTENWQTNLVSSCLFVPAGKGTHNADDVSIHIHTVRERERERAY